MDKPFTENVGPIDGGDTLKDWISPSTIKGKLLISFLILVITSGLCNLTALFSISKLEDKIQILKCAYRIDHIILEITSQVEADPHFCNSDQFHEKIGKLKELVYEIKASRNISRDKREKFYEYYKKLQSAPSVPLLKHIAADLKGLTEKTQTEAILGKKLSIWLLIYLPPIYIFASALLAIWILAPLERIRKEVAQVMSGTISTLPKDTAVNCKECAELVYAINKMLNSLDCKHHQLIQSEKMAALGKVTAAIAHEINNPLNNILLSADLLLEEISVPGHTEEVLKDIVTQTVRARKIVRHLLDFSRSGKSGGNARVNLKKLIEETLTMLRQQLKMSHIKVKKELEDADFYVEGNPTQLQQVLVNIILNGIEAMSAGGTLAITLRREEGSKAVIEIGDTGPGIPSEVVDLIFDPFYTTKLKGTGLGLSVSYGIVKDHDGEIRLESEAGKGATFYIILPLASNSNTAERGS